ncbi:MAG: NAD(P)-binding domain-containing protein [Parvibaculum sp.]|jgi:putative flavoprotein involved in K+ transport|nr:NAD(P)/FAD-dependent oxidoreductase [Parvibaculum sp.]MBX3487994.1 NAD(P)-binding domain-containing protein [Parvibaculum sp.]MBX3491583.1 NAD(P)-binding domain-containing protein [Parvibaculum sp.]|tara:strand:+ start:167761 stop:168900 length:1140 start_codon:yes stop_codon:yes gene_type:complete
MIPEVVHPDDGRTAELWAKTFDVLVIGAGQAGLAAGYRLAGTGCSFLIVDRQARIGDSWRGRYDSLTLFTPRAFSMLPGLSLDGAPDGYPTRDEFADYLETYADYFDLPVLSGNGVKQLRLRAGRFEATLDDGRKIAARAVIVATGAFQKSRIPPVAADFDNTVKQLTPDTYRNPGDVPRGAVLVAGDGASGRDIAAELSVTHNVALATGRRRRLFPERILGKSTWWWLRILGLMKAKPGSLAGRLMRRTDPFPDRGRSLDDLRVLGVAVVPRLVGADGRTAFFADGSTRELNCVIWCAGYHGDNAWLDIPGTKDPHGRFQHEGGRTSVPGLFHLGLPWQRNRASALVMGIEEDAAEIVAFVRDYLNVPMTQTQVIRPG